MKQKPNEKGFSKYTNSYKNGIHVQFCLKHLFPDILNAVLGSQIVNKLDYVLFVAYRKNVKTDIFT